MSASRPHGLLGLDELAVTRVETGEGGVRIVHLVTADPLARGCRECGVAATRVKERVVTQPRDVDVGGEAVRLLWHKRRWLCRETQCPLGSFTEQILQVPARARMTCRLREATGRDVADGGRTVAQAGRERGLSWPVAYRAFTGYAARVLPAAPAATPVLGIDEVRRGRPDWRQIPSPASGCWEPIRGMSDSSTPPAGRDCSGRSKAAPRKRSSSG